MKNSFTILVGIVILAGILSQMFLYQVRYDQVAVRSTFDKADDQSVQKTPGLKFRWPWPVHKITLYPKRLQVLEDKIEELQTADGKSVIVRVYLAWRIEDPLKFFVSLKEPEEASRQLASRLREIRGLISKYRFDELVNVDRSKIKLAQVENEARSELDKALKQADYGIKIETVGIYRIILPEATTDKVFETMIKTRQRLAENARQEGQAQASAIRSEANAAKDRILAFADRRAQTLRSEGDREAAREYASFARNEDFAIFLRKVEALKRMLAHNTTYVLSAEALGLKEHLQQEQAGKSATGAALQPGATSTAP